MALLEDRVSQRPTAPVIIDQALYLDPNRRPLLFEREKQTFMRATTTLINAGCKPYMTSRTYARTPSSSCPSLFELHVQVKEPQDTRRTGLVQG